DRLHRAPAARQDEPPLAVRAVGVQPVPLAAKAPAIGVVIAAVEDLCFVVPVGGLQPPEQRPPLLLEISLASQSAGPPPLARRPQTARRPTHGPPPGAAWPPPLPPVWNRGRRAAPRR